MQQLLAELIAEHRQTLAGLDQIAQAGPNTGRGQALLRSLRPQLLNHLYKEDTRLYPALQQQADEDQQLADVLKHFTPDMLQISAATRSFFEDWQSGLPGMDLVAEFSRLYQLLLSRIHKEEHILFEHYQERDHTTTPLEPDQP
ncbi:MAG: hemerythrin domain-containing protein [Leptospiraceae bacterium]|nr:hemerythrin domain-containing protein [Leptospiraceae bacterium]